MASFWRARLPLILVSALFVLGNSSEALTEDRLKCEEAAKHLANCCPNLTVRGWI